MHKFKDEWALLSWLAILLKEIDTNICTTQILLCYLVRKWPDMHYLYKKELLNFSNSEMSSMNQENSTTSFTLLFPLLWLHLCMHKFKDEWAPLSWLPLLLHKFDTKCSQLKSLWCYLAVSKSDLTCTIFIKKKVHHPKINIPHGEVLHAIGCI